MEELRGVWIPNTPHSQVLNSRDNIRSTMDYLKTIGCNVIFPVVWNQGHTLYFSKIMHHYGFPAIAPRYERQQRDPLDEVIEEARKVGLAVIPWFEYGFIGAAKFNQIGTLQPDQLQELPIFNQFPNWVAYRQRQFGPFFTGQEILMTGPHIWMNAFHPEVQQFLTALVTEVAENYDVDGIQLDDHFGLPVTGGYDDLTKALYDEQHGQDPPSNPNDPGWVQWRANLITRCMESLYLAVKKIGEIRNRNLVVSIAPSTQPFGFNHFLQDSDRWVEEGLVDMVHPQIYRPDVASYRREIDRICQRFGPESLKKFAPGLAFRANSVDWTADDIKTCIDLQRSQGFLGHVFFTNEGFRRDDGAMGLALRDGIYGLAASFPSFLNGSGSTSMNR